MGVYDSYGNLLNAVYDANGTQLSQAYDGAGNPLIDGGGGGDYDDWTTEYQHTILTARNAWQTEYRADNTIIPVIVHTDQHKYLNSAHKPTFDYLSLAIKWSEVTAIINLGDVCGAVYNATDLNNMLTCLSSIPKSKQINIAGNHDVQLKKEEGSSYAYAPMTDDLFHTIQDSYFNNSAFGSNSSNVRYGFKGMEYVIDPLHNIKFCVFAVWVTRGNPWYHYYFDSDTAEAMITMLSAVDSYDIVVLSHIQPYSTKMNRYKPAVDGQSASVIEDQPASLGYDVSLNQLFADRKAKRAGTIVDCDGVTHSYDFTGCTSDLICCFSGHSHTDYSSYSPDGNTPSIVFDAYRYNDVPMYLVNIDRTQQRLNVWKFDEASNVYNFQVPFSKPTAQQ